MRTVLLGNDMKSSVKTSVFGLLFFCFGFISCHNEMLSLTDIGETRSVGTERNREAPTGFKASNGKKSVVEFSWDWSDRDDIQSYEILQANSNIERNFSVALSQGRTQNADTSLKAGEKQKETAKQEFVPDGATRYYKIRAHFSDGTDSAESEIISGTTLAVPNIVYVEEDASNTMTLKWTMTNAEAYESDVVYKACCYNEKRELLAEEIVESYFPLEVTFTEMNADRLKDTLFYGQQLDSGKEYYYDVTAMRYFDRGTTTQTVYMTKCDQITRSTAYKIQPLPVEELTVSQGLSEGQIDVSWKLPDFAYVSTGEEYIRQPLYWTIERKEAKKGSAEYETIVNYLGVVKTDDKLGSNEFRFDCEENTVSANATDKIVIVSIADLKAGKLSDDEIGKLYSSNPKYVKYIPGSVIRYKDTDVLRGKKYTYRVRSYTDYNECGNKIVTGDKSVVEANGNLISTPILSTDIKYNINESDHAKYDSVEVSFMFTFDEMDSEYTYFITEKTKNLDNKEADYDNETLLDKAIFTSVNEVNSYKQKIDFTSNSHNGEGYHKYKIYVCPKNTSSKDITTIDAVKLAYCEANGGFAISSEVGKIPEISNFDIEYGYSDKFVLSWDYNRTINSNYSYKITWINSDGSVDENGNIFEINKQDLDLTAMSGKAVYTHNIPDGQAKKRGIKRTYTLYVSNDTSGSSLTQQKTFTYKDDNGNICQEVWSLGTPEIIQMGYDYTKISLKWDEIFGVVKTQKDEKYVSKYGITMAYDGEEPMTLTDDQLKIIPAGDDGIVTCTIEKFDGYNDTKKAGKNLNVTVTAVSSKTNRGKAAETKGTKKTHLLGPAALDVKTNDTEGTIKPDTIDIFWNKLEGAKGYFICRAAYSTVEAKEVKDKLVGYYVEAKPSAVGDKQKCTVSVVGEEGVSCVTSTDVYYEKSEGQESGIYHLEDKTQGVVNSQNKSYYDLQPKLVLGLPYGYVVLPLKEGDKGDSFLPVGQDSGKCDKETGTVGLNPDAPVKYDDNKIVPIIGATTGCGLNVTAEKLQRGDVINITWDAPYWAQKNKVGHPVIYRRRFSGNNTAWLAPKEALSTTDENEIVKDGVKSGKYSDYLKGLTDNDNKARAYEYAVSYYTGGQPYGSYVEYLANEKESKDKYGGNESIAEPKNKGYLYTPIYTISGASDGITSYVPKNYYYSEYVSLDWDYYDRALGPSSYKLSLKNLNVDGEWHDFYEISASSDPTKDGKPINDNGLGNYTQGVTLNDVYINRVQKQCRMWLTPMAIRNLDKDDKGRTKDGLGVSDEGMLKVLRDGRHYYKIEADFGNNKVVTLGENLDIYAYRNITDEELVKMTMLIIGQAMQESGVYGSGIISSDDGVLAGTNGTFKCGLWDGSETMQWAISNYQHTWINLPGKSNTNIPALLTLNDPTLAFRGRRYATSIAYISLDSGHRAKNFEEKWWIPMEVSGPMESCNATIKFALADDEMKFSVTHKYYEYNDNGSVKKTTQIKGLEKELNGKDNVRLWQPIEVGGVNWVSLGRRGTYYGGDDNNAKQFGWWPGSDSSE